MLKKIFFGSFFALTCVFLGGCSGDNPKWLLIEYPIPDDTTVMRFPGAKAEEYSDCVEQAGWVKDMHRKAGKYSQSKFQCGSNCRFSVEMASPLCDELKNL